MFLFFKGSKHVGLVNDVIVPQAHSRVIKVTHVIQAYIRVYVEHDPINGIKEQHPVV